VDSRIRSVSLSCGIELPSIGGSTKPKDTGTQLCNLYKSYLNRLPEGTIMKFCMDSKPGIDCKKCLADK
jgi:hypothetical protein